MENYIDKNVNEGSATYQAPFFVIERFPKEFKKGFLKSLDFRFLLILMTTFIISISFVSYLSSPQTDENSYIKDNRLHEKYARLLVQDNLSQDFLNSENKTKGTHLYGVFEEADVTRPEVESQQKIKSSSTVDNINKRVTQSQTTSMNNNAGHFSRTNEYTSKSDIGSKGLLKFITTDSRFTENPTNDIINIEQESSLSSLSNLKSLKIVRQNSDLAVTGERENNYTIRGTKIETVTLKDVVNSLSSKEQATSTIITKNVELEEILSSNLSNEKGNGETRSPEEITRVLMLHNRAIQDCYKQALKRNPNLKGKIVIRFTVTPNGTVNNADILNSTINDDKMKQCILRRVKRWNDFGYCDPALGDLSYRQTYVFGF